MNFAYASNGRLAGIHWSPLRHSSSLIMWEPWGQDDFGGMHLEPARGTEPSRHGGLDPRGLNSATQPACHWSLSRSLESGELKAWGGRRGALDSNFFLYIHFFFFVGAVWHSGS